MPQHCHNSKCLIFQEKLLKVLKCCNFLWVQRRHNCSPAASFANCVMTLYLLKVHLQTFLSIAITQNCQILSCDTLVANERYVCVCVCVYIYIYIYTHTHTHTHTHMISDTIYSQFLPFLIITYLLNYSMEQSPSWEANRFCS